MPVHRSGHSPAAPSQSRSAPHRASAAELKTIRAAVQQLKNLPMGKEALRVDGRGMQMFQHGTNVYIHDTRKDAWYVSSGHAAPRTAAPASTGHSGSSEFTRSVGNALGGLTREHRTDAIGIGVSGAAMNILMGAASIFGE